MFAIYTRRKGNRSRLDVQLSDLLRETMRRKATEPEDRIFALLGIMEHEGITYPSRLLGMEKGQQAFTMFTRIMIAQDGDLHALSVVGPPAKSCNRPDDRDTLSAVGPRTESTDRLSCASSPSKSSDRPSWAMSPTGFDNLPAPLLAGGIQSSSEKRGATGKTRAMMLRSVPNSEKPASDSDKELRLRGMRRGQIIRLVNLHESWQRIPSSPHSWCGLMGRLERLVGELMLPGTQGASRKAVLLGVVAKMLVRELFTLGRPGDRRDVGSTDVAATGLYYRFKASSSSGAALKGSVNAKKDAEILYEMAMKAFRFETAEASAHRLSLCSGIMGTELISWLDVTLSQDLAREVDFTCRNMNMAVTANGQVALVYPGVQVGDEVVLLMGGFLPFILRPTVPSWQLETEQRWQLLGEANLEGCLDGKTADRCEELCKVEAQGSSPQELEISCLT
ncbi:hypothetical protein BDY17DRAFT_327614 [Neohortaea acidophila]|uniref:Uncharacterized protein n=1 Tax=Neohortaea acidophila TaxID=245834 RepID=A0A6A6PI24_9PEZI|nr:uncharacterized protein BDY17DRAFT_327614 [Neohortaea acidophila]KAF2479670.1 hypothetical protein BDY17DRAFT_327614 [Neohortaea acidophila]